MEIKKDSKGRNLKPGEDQLKDGRYRYRYVDKYGNRKAIYSWKLTTTDKTPVGKREDICLREKIKNLSRDIEDGIRTYDAKITVSDLLDRYMTTKAKLATTTRDNYIHVINKNIKGTPFSNLRICDVKKSDVLKFYAYLHEEKHYATGTLQLCQNILYPAFQLAFDDDLIRKNPCKGCMKDYAHNSLHTDKKPLTREEQTEFLRFLQNNKTYRRYYELMALMLSTGCRISEALGLTWDDINLQEKYIKVDHQLIYKNRVGKSIHFIAPPKNKTSRIIPLQNDIISILQKYKAETYFMCKSCTYEVDGYKGFIFFNSKMKPHQPNTIVKALHLMVAAHNNLVDTDDGEIMLPDITPHTLRHTFCTRMAENGMDVKVLQEIMGHKTIEVTMLVYNHVSDERSQNEVQRVSSVLNVI